jgi:hypothetical protein
VNPSPIQAEEAQKRAYDQQRTSMLDRLVSENVDRRRGGSKSWPPMPLLQQASGDRPAYRSDCEIWSLGTTRCVHQIEMSLFLPFRNVTVAVLGVGRWAGAKPQRSAAPDRRPIGRSSQPHPFLPSERRSLGS